ncbi:zinc-dependent alcohol dehydrogenase family protein [Mucilaginibacter sp. OK098]|uniref:zinc-dependent alcohol dehydrogenase family protein n=1 Tax=Mucilaginibacter sp. OK098 TaxID=1855297 RepID=UPI000914CF1A|nr:NAD(P)-dependent alcohol dehydrogenase [Mucilaginibacter sp. OK098]SHM14322.1 NADPH:quinone reductase [Mucilaginibacter sp. OK098]
MKAYQITKGYSIASLSLIEKDHLQLLPNQVLVKIKALSLNYRDLLVIKGVDDWKPPVGRIPVSDGVGTIVEVGSEVTTVSANDRVAGLFLPNWLDGKLTAEKLANPLGGKVRDGLLQEYVVFNENELIKVPAFLTDSEAATLPCAGLTAWHSLMEKDKIQPGNTVLIQGTGGVSLFSIQFALMAGAEVILLSGSDEKLQRAKQMGVNHLINYKQFPNWEDEVLNITNGRGVDHVVEVVGSDHINKSIDAVALDGTISIIGLINGLKGNINTVKIMTKQIKLQGINVGSKEMFNKMNNALEVNNIHPIIDKTYSFDEAKEALTLLERSSHFGKLCISL